MDCDELKTITIAQRARVDMHAIQWHCRKQGGPNYMHRPLFVHLCITIYDRLTVRGVAFFGISL
jgi:hypothetical protein